MFRHRSACSRLMAGLLLVAGSCLSGPVSAQTLATQVPSLKWVPAKAGTYSAMLRNKEQIDTLLKSKAVAKLMEMPAAKMAMVELAKELANPFGPLSQAKNWYDQNAELVEMAKDLVSDEIFMYADKNCAEFFALLPGSLHVGPARPAGDAYQGRTVRSQCRSVLPVSGHAAEPVR